MQAAHNSFYPKFETCSPASNVYSEKTTHHISPLHTDHHDQGISQYNPRRTKLRHIESSPISVRKPPPVHPNAQDDAPPLDGQIRDEHCAPDRAHHRACDALVRPRTQPQQWPDELGVARSCSLCIAAGVKTGREDACEARLGA